MADDNDKENTMKLSTTEWNTLRDETRNAAVELHFARTAFLASAPKVVDGKQETPETITHAENRQKLRDARDAYTDKIMAIQSAIVDDLDISWVANETLPPVHEELLDAPPNGHEHAVEVVQPGPGDNTTPAPSTAPVT